MTGANNNQNYNAYYLATSPYPIRPITNSNVSSLSVAMGNVGTTGPNPTKSGKIAALSLLLLALASLFVL